jgi:flavin reductase (DIM6/NTAB) family NADH-FMN oxidoreductase RutF
MTAGFRHINVRDIRDNSFEAIGKDWMLVTAGSIDSFNMMTANWGTMGILWHRPVAICFIRPQRFTYELVEKNEYFTLCFLEEQYREALNVCGSLSGRNVDKAKATGLTPIETTNGNIYFEESRLVLECHKLYADKLEAQHFFQKGIIDEVYTGGDFHKFFIGEIVSCLQKTGLQKS